MGVSYERGTPVLSVFALKHRRVAAEGAQKTGSEVPRAYVISAFRRADVANQLRQALPELEVEEKFEDETSGYILDIRASGKGANAGRGWAVEVDGPWRFVQV